MAHARFSFRASLRSRFASAPRGNGWEVMVCAFSAFRFTIACLIESWTWPVPGDAGAHHHATDPGGTHAHTEIVAGPYGRRPAAGCEPVRRHCRRERAAVR